MNIGRMMHNIKTRRKGSMLQDSLSKIKYILVLAFLLAIPMRSSYAGLGLTDPIDQTDTGGSRLIYYYDELGRHTLIQVTNTSDQGVGIHVQVYSANEQCAEVDFPDCLTPGQTTVYDMEALPGSFAMS